MIVLLLLVGYLAGFLYTARRVALAQIEEDARSASHVPSKEHPLVDTEGRVLAVLWGACIGIVWPIAAVVYRVARGLRSPTEIAAEERAELEALRKQARDLDLPMPEA